MAAVDRAFLPVIGVKTRRILEFKLIVDVLGVLAEDTSAFVDPVSYFLSCQFNINQVPAVFSRNAASYYHSFNQSSVMDLLDPFDCYRALLFFQTSPSCRSAWLRLVVVTLLLPSIFISTKKSTASLIDSSLRQV
jgi:hypothetical protein